MKKRVLSMLLVLVMVLSMVPVFASAATATPKITKVSMTLNGILDVNFKVASNGADMSKCSIAIIGAAAQTIDSYSREGDLYVYTAKVPAHKLNEDMTVNLMYDGVSVQTKTWNAGTDYLSTLTGSAELTVLAASLQSYGTYAAAYAKGETGTAIDGITADKLEAYKPVIGTYNSALGVVAALYLDDAADLLVKFNEAAWLDTYQLKINGEAATVTDNGEGKMIYRRENLLPQDWSSMYDIKVVNGETVVYQVSYGVNSYVWQALSRSTEAAPGLNNLLKSMYAYGTAAKAYAPASKTPIALTNLPLRDPFILNDGDAYYLYATGGDGSFNVWSSTDLQLWYDEGACFTVEAGDAYYDTTNSEQAFWAPEVFAYNGSYYMFATFTQEGTGKMQGTAILKADSPKGPFTKWSDGFVTPAGHSALDGTLYIENGTPYMIYCHEWECSCLNGTGTVDYIKLSADLKSTEGDSQQLFAANQFSWGYFWNKKYSTVTDGVHVYTKDGTNYLQWSTSINGVYTVAYTTFETLAGGVSGTHTKLYEDNGGHGMIFTDMNGVDKLVLHTPNDGATAYPALFNVNVSDGALSLEGVKVWDGFGVDIAPQLGNKGYTENTTFFIGDSFFDNAFWDNFHKDLAGKDAVIAGIGSTTSEDWSQYIAKGYIFSSNVAPKNIVINLGNNDVYTDRLGADEACGNLQALLTTLKTKYPSTGIYLFSITPRTDDSTTVLNAVNTAMNTWCDSNGVTFVDISGYTMELTDGIHPADAHYNDVFLAALQSAGCTIADKTSMAGDTSGMTYADGVYSALNPNIYNWHFMDTTYDNFELEMTVTPLTDSTYAGFVVAQNGHTVMIRQKPYYQYQSDVANDDYINTVWDWNWADSVNAWKQIPNIPTFKINEPVTMKLSYIGGVFNLYVSDGNGGWNHLQQMTVDYLTDPTVGTGTGGNTAKYITFDPAQPFAVGFATSPIYPSAATFSNVKLTQIDAYAIVYELGGGTLDGSQPTSYTNATAGEIVLPTPTREHYTFQGWYIGETKVESLEGYTGSLTLTAKWAPAKSSGMTLSDGVYTDNTSGNNYSYWFMDGEASNFDLQMTVTAGTDNTFGGFVVRQDDNVVLIRQKAAGQDDYINTVFNWQAGEGSNGNAWKQIVGIPTFANGTPVTMRLTLADGTFTLYTSDGSGGWTKLQDMSVTYLTDPTVGTNAGGANSVGCTLDASKPFEVGFATDRIYDAAGTVFTNVIYSVDSVVVNEWSISYNTDGGTNPDSAPATYTAETAATVVLPTPTKSGYLFMGWYDESGAYIDSLAGQTGVISLTAQWVQENYNITANDGVYTANNTSAAFNYHMVDTQFSNDFELEVDIINGINNAGFVGFIVQQGGNNVTIRMKGNEGDKCFDFYYNHGTDGGRWHVNNAIPAFPQNTAVRMKLAYSNGTFTVYKQDGSSWTKIQDMTLDYLTSGAGMPGGSQSGAWGNLPSFTFDANKPFAVGFGGFHGDGANGINSTFQNVKFTDRSNLTEYPISYDLGGGEVVGTAPTSYNDTNAESIVLPGATRSGYVFMGWYIGSDYVTNLAGRSGTVTLTAKWLDQTGCGYEGTIYPDEYEISYSNGVYSCGGGHQFNYYYMDKASKDFELTVTFNMDAAAPNNMGFVISQGEGKTQFIQLSNNSGNLWCDIFPNFVNGNNNWFYTGTYVAPGTSVTLKLAYSNGAFTLKDANGAVLMTLSLADIVGNPNGGSTAGFTYDPNLPFAVGFGNRYAYGTFTNVTYTDNTAN